MGARAPFVCRDDTPRYVSPAESGIRRRNCRAYRSGATLHIGCRIRRGRRYPTFLQQLPSFPTATGRKSSSQPALRLTVRFPTTYPTISSAHPPGHLRPPPAHVCPFPSLPRQSPDCEMLHCRSWSRTACNRINAPGRSSFAPDDTNAGNHVKPEHSDVLDMSCKDRR